MSVSPPSDRILKITSTIINELSGVVLTLLGNISLKLENLEEIINLIPKSAGCNDQRVQQVRNIIDSINRLIATIQRVKTPLNGIISSFRLVSNIASAVKLALIALPLPVPAAANEVVAVQNQTVSNALAAVTVIQGLFDVIDISLSPVEKTLSTVSKRLAQICPDVPVNVNQNTADIINETSSTGDPDIDQQLDSIDQDLNDVVAQQPNLIVSYIDPQSEVFTGTSNPDNVQGKLGDYFIDTSNRIIYGPKPLIGDWGDGQNY